MELIFLVSDRSGRPLFFNIFLEGINMLLAERTEDHLRLFEEGAEAEFFNGPEELADKLRRYLADDAARARVAAAGRVRCLRDRYSMHDQFARITEWLDGRVL